MPFDPARDLPVILGSLAGMGRGSNAFSRRWMQLEQMRQQQQMQEQQMARADRAEARQGDMQQQQLMLQSENQRLAGERQRIDYTQGLQRLFADPNVDPDTALALATMGAPEGYDTGAVQSMHARVFTPDERTRRKAAKRLADIEADPQVKKLLQSGQDIGATTWEATDLGGNPEDPEGRPIYTMAQLQRLAQKPTPAAPLPKAATASNVNAGSFEEFSTATPERRAEILTARRAYTEAGREPDRAAQGSPQWVISASGTTHYRVPQAGDTPRDPVAERNQPTESASPYAAERTVRTIQSVDELMGKVSRWTTGLGSLLANIPESEAVNFASELDTLKANIAFNELTAMREASKTGGALGNVSDREMALLSSALGALNTKQGPANMRAQLQKIRDSVNRWRIAQGLPEIPVGQPQAAPMAPAGRGPGPVGSRQRIGRFEVEIGP